MKFIIEVTQKRVVTIPVEVEAHDKSEAVDKVWEIVEGEWTDANWAEAEAELEDTRMGKITKVEE
jgi:hypothetical protein